MVFRFILINFVTEEKFDEVSQVFMNGHRMNAKNPNLKAVHWKKINWKNLRMILQKFTTKRGQIMVKGKQIEAKKSVENVSNHETYFRRKHLLVHLRKR